MLGRVSHPPASKRHVFGWQTKRYPSVIGARRVEIESDVRIDRVGIAELPLQHARREQTSRTARRKHHGYRLGAEIHGKSSIAASFGLGGDVWNMSTPSIRHRLDACRTHDQSRRIDLSRGLGNLDLRTLHVAQLGPIVG